MLTCDGDHRFIDLFAMYKGSIIDANVFKDSKLNKLTEDATEKYQVVLLGDHNFPCLRYLMTPIKNRKY